MAATNGAGAGTNPVHEPPHKVAKMAPLLKVKKLSDKVILPSRGSALDAGYDLSSTMETVVPARGKALVATGLSIAIPVGTYACIAPRSGLALKHAIDVGAGVIDTDYHGPVGVLLLNHSGADFAVKPGDRPILLLLIGTARGSFKNGDDDILRSHAPTSLSPSDAHNSVNDAENKYLIMCFVHVC